MDQNTKWREAMASQPIESCGRLDMETFLPDPVKVGRVESDRIRYVYFADKSECVVVGNLCDFVAFRAADYDSLKAQLAAANAQVTSLRKQFEGDHEDGCSLCGFDVGLFDALDAANAQRDELAELAGKLRAIIADTRSPTVHINKQVLVQLVVEPLEAIARAQSGQPAQRDDDGTASGGFKP
jgi:hypothetical protein